MSDEHIELSHTGFKVSYLRFISDGAVGPIIILLILAAYYLDTPFDFHHSLTLHHGQILQVGREVKIFVLIVLVTIAIPPGLTCNALGWFVLGWLQAWGARFWFRHSRSFLARATCENYSYRWLGEALDLSSENFFELSQFFEDTARIKRSYEAQDLAHVKGIKRLIRSMVVILLLTVACASSRLGWWLALAAAMEFLLCALLTLLEFYERLGILQKVCILSFSTGDERADLSEKERLVLRRLLQGAPSENGTTESVTGGASDER